MDMLTATFITVAMFAILGALFAILAAIADRIVGPWIIRRRIEKEYEERNP